jgi:hypothetical protein
MHIWYEVDNISGHIDDFFIGRKLDPVRHGSLNIN